jgi:hypothetical protein
MAATLTAVRRIRIRVRLYCLHLPYLYQRLAPHVRYLQYPGTSTSVNSISLRLSTWCPTISQMPTLLRSALLLCP